MDVVTSLNMTDENIEKIFCKTWKLMKLVKFERGPPGLKKYSKKATPSSIKPAYTSLYKTVHFAVKIWQ